MCTTKKDLCTQNVDKTIKSVFPTTTKKEN